MPDRTLTRGRQLATRCFMKRLVLAILLLVAALGACSTAKPVANTPRDGWKQYHSPRSDYSLSYPPSWKLKGGGDEEDQNISPGLDPSTAQVWFTIDTRTEKEVRGIEHAPDCYHYGVSNSIYHQVEQFELGGRKALRFSLSTPPGYPGEAGFGMAVDTRVGNRCFRFHFVSSTKDDWTRS